MQKVKVKMKIGELAKHLGITTSKIRYYESSGLMGEVGRKENGFRIYDEHALARLTYIADAQRAGLDLDSIRSLLQQENQLPKSERAQRALLKELKARLESVDLLQTRLKTQKAELMSSIAQLQSKLDSSAEHQTSPSQQSLL